MDEDAKKNLKQTAQGLFSAFLERVDKGESGTFIVTTDGRKGWGNDSNYPLPKRYLAQWEKDARDGVDLSL